MAKDDVSIVRCADYEQNNVDIAVQKAFELLGGIKKFVKKGQNVALKVNLVHRATPEKAVTTHPAVVLAVAKMIKSVGADCFIVDSAGGLYTAGAMAPIYKASGMSELQEKQGIKINDNYESVTVGFAGQVNKQLVLLDALEKADIIFNLCKLKTHGFTGVSNAVKNMFGAIPGLIKVEYHGKFQNLENFNHSLYDIHNYYGKKLCLHISDAVMGMEGDGPTHGTPRFIGCVFMGRNPATVDVTGCKIINIDPKLIPTITVGQENGYLNENLEYTLLGDKIEDFIIKDYKNLTPDKYIPFASSKPKYMQVIINRWMTQRPVIKPKQCKGCNKCVVHCPLQAIEMTTLKNKKYAKIDYSKCIRCYCCQELCPFGVVKIKSGWLYKIRHRRDKK